MKTVRIFPEKESSAFPFDIILETTPLPDKVVTGPSSFDLTICFAERGKIKQGKLTLLTKTFLGSIVSYVANLAVDKHIYQCIVHCYHRKDMLSEYWMTIMEESREVQKFEIDLTKTEFITKAKEYYKDQDMSFNEDGNLTQGISYFSKAPKEGEYNGRIRANIIGPNRYDLSKIITTEVILNATMYKNIFPLHIANEHGLIFFEWLDENHIRSCSQEEVFVKNIRHGK
jgi:hypothetical protein